MATDNQSPATDNQSPATAGTGADQSDQLQDEQVDNARDNEDMATDNQSPAIDGTNFLFTKSSDVQNEHST